MERDALLTTLREESAALLDAARAAGPLAPVPGVPGWTVADLVWHVGKVHDFWGWIVRRRAESTDGYEDPVRPADAAGTEAAFDATMEFAAGRANALYDVLAGTDPTTPMWSWAPQKDAAFALRRMVHETAVHRCDAERAAGYEHRLPPELAADGIDELLTFFLADIAPDTAPLAGSVHLHCTDAEGEWTVWPDGTSGVRVTPEHAKADTAIRGDAHDLLMALWRRTPLATVTVFGDADLATSFVLRASTD